MCFCFWSPKLIHNYKRYETRKADRLAVSKIVTKHAQQVPRSNLAVCLLVQFTKALLAGPSTPQQSTLKTCFEFLERSV